MTARSPEICGILKRDHTSPANLRIRWVGWLRLLRWLRLVMAVRAKVRAPHDKFSIYDADGHHPASAVPRRESTEPRSQPSSFCWPQRVFNTLSPQLRTKNSYSPQKGMTLISHFSVLAVCSANPRCLCSVSHNLDTTGGRPAIRTFVQNAYCTYSTYCFTRELITQNAGCITHWLLTLR